MSINDRFYKVLGMGIPRAAKGCIPNGFLGVWDSTCEPYGSPLGPRSSDGLPILGSRSDEIGNSGITCSFLVNQKKGLMWGIPI